MCDGDPVFSVGVEPWKVLTKVGGCWVKKTKHEVVHDSGPVHFVTLRRQSRCPYKSNRWQLDCMRKEVLNWQKIWERKDGGGGVGEISSTLHPSYTSFELETSSCEDLARVSLLTRSLACLLACRDIVIRYEWRSSAIRCYCACRSNKLPSGSKHTVNPRGTCRDNGTTCSMSSRQCMRSRFRNVARRRNVVCRGEPSVMYIRPARQASRDCRRRPQNMLSHEACGVEWAWGR